MPEAGRLEVEATVLEALPNALFRVELRTESRPRLVAHLSSPALLRLLPGDAVRVEVSAYDANRGRIVGRA